MPVSNRVSIRRAVTLQVVALDPTHPKVVGLAQWYNATTLLDMFFANVVA
jgi:hypothetical protein